MNSTNEHTPIYLDYAASTPIDPSVMECMLDALKQVGNPSANHVYGQAAKDAIERAREQVANAISAELCEIIWTSGATEANNLAIKGLAAMYQTRGKHIVTMQTEHRSVLDACQHLERFGHTVTYLAPNQDGLLSLSALKAAIRNDTVLVSIMAVNNETGVMQDLAAIRRVTLEHGVMLHVDAAQAIGKMPINVRDIQADALSLSAHKVYGPKGIGALYLQKRPRRRVIPLLHGGGHEQGLRSGTLPTHQIVGMGQAFLLAKERFAARHAHVKRLRDIFLEKLASIATMHCNTNIAFAVPHILNVRFKGSIADALLQSAKGIAATTSSACQAQHHGASGASYVLKAMGYDDDAIRASIRFSFGHDLSEEDVREAADEIVRLFSQ